MQRALEVLFLFASQKALINISLTAIGMLWHVTDTLGRSRPSVIEVSLVTSSGGAEDAGGRALGASGSFSAGGSGGAAVAAAASATAALGLSVPGLPAGAAAGGAAGGGADGRAAPDHSYRRDMGESEVTAQLLRVFTHLRQLSTDARPEVRASAFGRE